MIDFLAGASGLATLLVALFFLRFYSDTGDRLFLLFAIAFGVFAVNRVILTVLDDDDEGRTIVYLVRAAAFALIALAILDKNRTARERR